MRFVRFAIFALFIIVVLIPATVVGVAYFLVNSELGRTEAQTRADGLFPNAALRFEDVEVGAQPMDLHIHGLRLGPRDGDAIGSVEHLSVGIDPLSLVRGPMRVDKVHMEGFDLRLEFDAQGRPVATNLFERPGPPPGEEKAPSKPMELRDLRLSEGTLRFIGPDWSLRLTGAICAGRLEQGASSETTLTCDWAGGEAIVPAGGDGEPVTLTFGASRVGHIMFQRGPELGERIVIDGLSVDVDGAVIRGNLTAARAPDALIPTFSLSLGGEIPRSVTRLLSSRRVDGAVQLELLAQGGPKRVDATLARLAVDGLVRLPDRSIEGLTLTNVRLQAVGTDVSVMGTAGALGISGGDVRLRGIELQAALSAQIPEGGLAGLASGSAASSGAPAIAPTSARGHIDRLTAASVESGPVSAQDLRIEGADVDYTGLGGSVKLTNATAKKLRVGAEQLDGAKVSGDLQFALMDGGTLKAHVDLGARAGQAQGAVDIAGKASMERDGMTFLLPFTLEVAVRDIPGQRLAARLPTGMVGRVELAALLNGVVTGSAQVAGDLRKPAETRLMGAEFVIPHEKEIVTFRPADNALVADDGLVAFDARSRRLRVGPVTLGWSTERIRTPRGKGGR